MARLVVVTPVAFSVNYVEQAPDGVAKVALRVVSDGQGRARLELQHLDSNRVETRLFDARPRAGVELLDRAPVWLQWWMGRDGPALATASALALERTSLDHIDGTVLWVVGAGPREPDVPQLGIERMTGLLRHAVALVDGAVRVTRLGAFVTEDGVQTCFPARLDVIVDGRKVTLVNTWLRTGEDARVDPKEFDPPASG